jgi:hypothetical protein
MVTVAPRNHVADPDHALTVQDRPQGLAWRAMATLLHQLLTECEAAARRIPDLYRRWERMVLRSAPASP